MRTVSETQNQTRARILFMLTSVSILTDLMFRNKLNASKSSNHNTALFHTCQTMCWSLRRFGNLLTAEATKCSFFIVRMLFKSAVNFPVSWPFFGARPDNNLLLPSCRGQYQNQRPRLTEVSFETCVIIQRSMLLIAMCVLIIKDDYHRYKILNK